MRIKKYGVTLSRLKRGDIELVRTKRNSAEINRWMHFRDVITPEMQTAWFDSVNNMFNGYFLIECEAQKIGLIHLKNLDFDNRTCEGGIFIWDRKHWGTGVSVLASVMLTDFAFYIMNFRTIYAKVLRTNRAAQSYNRSLGYVLAKHMASDDEVEWLELEKSLYEQKIPPIRNAVAITTGDSTPLSVANIDFVGDSAREIEKLYLGLPEDILDTVRPALQDSKQLFVRPRRA